MGLREEQNLFRSRFAESWKLFQRLYRLGERRLQRRSQVSSKLVQRDQCALLKSCGSLLGTDASELSCLIELFACRVQDVDWSKTDRIAE